MKACCRDNTSSFSDMLLDFLKCNVLTWQYFPVKAHFKESSNELEGALRRFSLKILKFFNETQSTFQLNFKFSFAILASHHASNLFATIILAILCIIIINDSFFHPHENC